VLGFAELPRPAVPVPGAWFQAGDQQIHVAQVATHEAPRRNHFALEVADVDAVVAALTEAGIDVRHSPPLAGAGRQAVLRDPAGNVIELNQPHL
jgi:catechol 2,3-dioxygenase-like lactoylglutathione lyase family enzyme